YFPDPDLPSLRIDDAWLERVRTELPELAEQKRARYVRDLGISEAAAGVLTANKNISVLFETVVQKTGQAAETANLITGEIIRLMNSAGILPEDLFAKQGAPSEGRKEFLPFAQKLAVLVNLVTGGKINRGSCRQTVEAVFTDNVDPEKYIAEKGLLMVSDDNAVTEAVRAVLAEEQNSVEDYRAGKAKVFGFLMGQVMKKISKAGNPELAKKVLEDALKA
ncbi:MAG: hypothetical protein FWF29_09125, partial [Treponema sp.]|nr:hypothetical protein [Treponema sp.]